MSKKNELKKSNKIILIVLMVLMAIGCTINIIDVVKTQNISSIVMLVYYAFVFYYAIYGHKIPHGNLLKYLVLSFSFMQFFKCFSATNTIVTNNIFYGIAIILIAYMSGRLDHLKQNNIIATIALICLLIPNVTGFIDSKTRTPVEELPQVEQAPKQEEQDIEPDAMGILIMNASQYSSVLLWATIVSAYNVRFLTHRKAGLTDK